MFFASTFIDVSNLDGAFLCFGDVIMKKFFMLLYGHFIDITCLSAKTKTFGDCFILE